MKTAVSSSNDKLTAQIKDALDRFSEGGVRTFIGFLNEKEQMLSSRLFSGRNFDRYLFFGGMERSERRMLGVGTLDAGDFPIVCYRFCIPKEHGLAHGDFLGAFMAKLIKREVIGDIIIEREEAFVFLINGNFYGEFASIEKIGNKRVSFMGSSEPPRPKEIEFEAITKTAASERLDAVTAALIGSGRTRVQDLIAAKKVGINGETAEKPDKKIKPGDILTVRGHGKFKVDFGGTTKKGRIKITAEKYI